MQSPFFSVFILCASFFQYRRNRRHLGINQRRRQQRLVSKETKNFIIKISLITLGYTLTCVPFTVFSYQQAVLDTKVEGGGEWGVLYNGRTFHTLYEQNLQQRYFFTILYLTLK